MKDRFGQRLMHWRIAAVMPHLKGRVLDLGCGTNDLLKTYRAKTSQDSQANRSLGLDVFDWPGADQLIEDAAELPFDDESFDTICIVAALNHIPNRIEALQECRRLIRPDGRIILTMIPPRISRVWHKLRKPWDADQTERGMQPGEVFGLSRRQTDRLLFKVGFKPTRHARFMAGLNVLTIAEPAPLPAPANVAEESVMPRGVRSATRSAPESIGQPARSVAVSADAPVRV